MKYLDAVARLEVALERPLPGPRAHAFLAPVPIAGRPPHRQFQARSAAGLVAIFPREGRLHVILTVRAGTLPNHSGQVALPGGAVDHGESIEAAALREAHEEIGLSPWSVRTLGRLSPLDIFVSGFRLHPIVGVLEERPLALSPAVAEVERILDLSVDDLMDPAHFGWRHRERDGVELRVPAFLVQGVEIWGATAMVLAELMTLIGWQGPDQS